MTEFIYHTLETAPAASKSLLQKAKEDLGFIPNLMAALAESPATLESYLLLKNAVDTTSFTITERHLLLLTISRYHNCCYCLAAHASLAKKQKVAAELINAVYFNQPLNDNKLDALRAFTREILKQQGWIQDTALQNFYHAGYKQQHVLEVMLAISFKTLSDYFNHINDTPIDRQFLVGLPDNNFSPCGGNSTADLPS